MSPFKELGEDEAKASHHYHRRILSMSNKNIQRREKYRSRDATSRVREAVRLKRQHAISHGKKLLQRTAWCLLDSHETKEKLLWKVEDRTRELFSRVFSVTTEGCEVVENLPGPKRIAEEVLKQVLADNATLFTFGGDGSLPSEIMEWA